MVDIYVATLVRSDDQTKREEVGRFYDMDFLKRNAQIGVDKAAGHPVELTWQELKEFKMLITKEFSCTSKRFQDTEPQSYILSVHTEQYPSVTCECGKEAIRYKGYSGYRCQFCGADFYINHCWKCGSSVDSRVMARCRTCGYYVCNCGACSSTCSDVPF